LVISSILRSNSLEIQQSGGFRTIKPQKFSLDVKVIVIGEMEAFDQLCESREDFKQIFKIRADLENTLPLTPSVIKQYSQLIKQVIIKEKLLPFDKL